METLIVLCHGSSKQDGSLSVRGKADIEALGRKLQPYPDGMLIALTSTAPWAVESTELLTANTPMQTRARDGLWSDNDHPMNLVGAFEIVKSVAGFDTVIVVTHQEYVNQLPGYFAIAEWGFKLPDIPPIRNGQAVVLDCNAKTRTLVL